tara:strand:+ start:19641 stop:20213 length:573 start_codon:yes stop_codon:yes gene_type:complete
MTYLSLQKSFLASLLILLFSLESNLAMAQETQTQEYQVIKELKGAELRYYPPAMKIQSNNDFGSLFNYISGNNSTQEKISMTSPVYMGDGKGNNVMEFVLPKGFNLRNTPEALSNNVKVFESKPGYFLALQFSGYANSRNIYPHARNLYNLTQEYGYTSIGQVMLLVYDSPYKLIGRKNEIVIQIDEDSI